MLLAQSLIDVYDRMEKLGQVYISPRKGVVEGVEETILPVFLINKNTEIEFVLDNNGVIKDIIHQEQRIPFLVTTKSVNKTSSYAPHVLFEQVKTLLDNNKLTIFLTELKKWIDFDAPPQIEILKKFYEDYFLNKDETLLAKLKKILSEKIDIGDESSLEEMLSLLCSKNAETSTIRVRIESDDADEYALWYSESVYQSYMKYRNFQVEQSANHGENGVTEICMLTGQPTTNSTHLSRGVLAMKKLFCVGNDIITSMSETLSLDEINSWKVSNVLEWLWRNRRLSLVNTSDNVIIWEDSMSNYEEPNEYLYFKKMFGYSKLFPPYLDAFEKKFQFNVLVLNSRENGRMLIRSFDKYNLEQFNKNINFWDSTIIWSKANGEIIKPTLPNIIKLAYNMNLDEFKKYHGKTFLDLINKHVNGAEFPASIVMQVKKRLILELQTQIVRQLDIKNSLNTYCAIQNHSFYKGGYNLSLHEGNTNRDYLFGRLLAIAHNYELKRKYSKMIKLGEFEDDRKKDEESDSEEGDYSYLYKKAHSTIALRKIYAFEKRPATTWSYIFKTLAKRYKRDITFPRFLNSIEEVIELFNGRDFVSEKPLSPEYLLAFSLQLNALDRKKKEAAEAFEQLENNDIAN